MTRERTLGDQGKQGARVGQSTLGVWVGWCGRQVPRDRDPQGLGETKGAPDISSLHPRRTGPCWVLQPHQAAAPNPDVLPLQLVPKFCEYWYDQVLQEGASSLDSHTISLQLSNSFDLMELIEQYNMSWADASTPLPMAVAEAGGPLGIPGSANQHPPSQGQLH